MDIRSGMDSLKSILGVTQPEPSTPRQVRSGATQETGGLDADQATFSSAGSQVALTAAGGDVRPEKVASIQAALAAGTYSVPPSAVATSMVQAMLGNGR